MKGKKALITLSRNRPQPKVDEPALRKEILLLQAALAKKESLVKDLQYVVETRDRELIEAQRYIATRRKGVSKSLFFLLFIVALGLGGFAAYDKYYKPDKLLPTDTTNVEKKLAATTDPITDPPVAPTNEKPIKKTTDSPRKKLITPIANATKKPVKKTKPVIHNSKYHLRQSETYAILKDAYFYNAPDASKRTDIYLTPGDADLTLKEERGDFQYAIFIDGDGKPVKGWLLKKDFKAETDY